MRYFVHLFIVTLFFFNTVTAQEADDSLAYTISHYTDEDGLPQNSIKDIFQDETGFIWLATEGGLVRFDGKDFRVFDKTNLPCMTTNRFVMMLRITEMGNFAILEHGVRLQIRNGFPLCPSDTKSELTFLRLKWNKFPGLTNVATTGLPQKFFIKSTDNYIIPFGVEKFINCLRRQVYFTHKERVDSVAFFSDNDCRGFFTVGEELYYLRDSSTLSNIRPEGVYACRIEGDILADKSFKPGKSKIAVFWNLSMRNTLFYYNRSFYAIERAAEGNLVTRLIFSGFDITSTRLFSHYYDKAGERLFLGSMIHGLYVLKTKTFRVLVEDANGTDRSYYAVNVYDSTHLITPKGLLIGPESMVSLASSPEKVKSDRSQIQLDRFGFIWTKEAGFVYRSDRRFNVKDTLKLPGEITSLYCSMDDTTLWIGTKKKGLYRVHISEAGQTGPLQRLPAAFQRITFLASESKEKLWIGTEKGLYYLNTATDQLFRIDQLNNRNIRSILVKTPAEIWITTYGDGIYLLRGNRLDHLPHDYGKSLLTSHCMMLDQNDFFWISTNKGLIKASRKDMIAYADRRQTEVFYQYFGKESGFHSNEFNGGCQPCATRLSNGLITFPSLDGLVQVNPVWETEELPDRELIIDKVEVDNRLVTLRDTLTIPRKFDNLSIYLSTVYFGNPKNLQVSYMLLKNNKEDQWYPVKDRLISLTSLPPGSYQLRIRKMNGFGKDNYHTISLNLVVPHAFYETLWFKLLMVAVLLLVVYSYTRIRLYVITQRNRLLDLQIARRTRTLTNTLRALKVSEASLRRQTHMQEMLIAAISHDIKSPMKYLTMVSKRMQQLLGKKDYVSLTAFNESIQDTADKVYTILDNLVTYISFQLKGGQIRKEAVDIFKLVENKINVFAAIAGVNNTELRNTIAPGTCIEGDEDLLAVIIHNLIDNAVKFTANGHVEIYEAEPEDERFVLVIKDTGTGIPEELVRWLNARSENGLDIGTIGSHKGMGLIIIKELLTAASADILVVSGMGGTTIKMYFKRYEPTDL